MASLSLNWALFPKQGRRMNTQIEGWMPSLLVVLVTAAIPIQHDGLSALACVVVSADGWGSEVAMQSSSLIHERPLVISAIRSKS